MREILFRGKRIDNGEWVEGGYWVNDTITRQTTHIINHDGNAHAVDPATVCQYTGLTDENGVKIFEGDILDENGYHFMVVYDHKWAKFKLQYINKAIQYPEWNRGILMEVIGNINDNPELREEAPHA